MVDMNGFICVEVLMATILVWTAVFGVVELWVNTLETQGQKLAAYVSVLIPVLLFAGTYGHFSSCLLL